MYRELTEQRTDEVESKEISLAFKQGWEVFKGRFLQEKFEKLYGYRTDRVIEYVPEVISNNTPDSCDLCLRVFSGVRCCGEGPYWCRRICISKWKGLRVSRQYICYDITPYACDFTLSVKSFKLSFLHLTMFLRTVKYPVLDHNKQSVTVPGTKKPGQSGMS